MVEHLVTDCKVDVNATNDFKHTPLDILEQMIKSQSQTRAQTKPVYDGIEELLHRAGGMRAKDVISQGKWLTKKRESLMVVASLMATMAFQAGVCPPGGAWQSDAADGRHRAGEAVVAYTYPNSYKYFLRANTIGFVTSLTTILLLISGLPFKKRPVMWVLVVTMWVTITSMAFTYAFANVVVTPKKGRHHLSFTILVAVIVWCGVMGLLLLWHTARLVRKMLLEDQSRRKAERLFKNSSSSSSSSPSSSSCAERILRCLNLRNRNLRNRSLSWDFD